MMRGHHSGKPSVLYKQSGGGGGGVRNVSIT